MQLLRLNLTNFRNYACLELELPSGIIVLQGQNAQGKTNLLEAIHYLSRVRSSRAGSDSELVNWLALDDDLPFARLLGRYRKRDSTNQIEISLVQGKRNSESDVSVLRKHARVNGVDRRVNSAVGMLNVVLFMPEDIDLVSGSPYLRRRYLDDTISQQDSRYRRELEQYRRVLTQRNHLLKSFRHSRPDAGQLAFWDQKLAQHGTYLITRRRNAVARLNEAVQHLHPRLTGEAEWLQLEYCSSVALDADSGLSRQMSLLPQRATPAPVDMPLHDVADTYLAQLQEIQREEFERGMSLLGPHRDDVRFMANGIDMHIFGSRGQQRASALSLKLAEVEWLADSEQDKPILLLDDVLSELDAVHRKCLLTSVDEAQQVIVTTTDTADFSQGFLDRAAVWQVSDGRIREIKSP